MASIFYAMKQNAVKNENENVRVGFWCGSDLLPIKLILFHVILAVRYITDNVSRRTCINSLRSAEGSKIRFLRRFAPDLLFVFCLLIPTMRLAPCDRSHLDRIYSGRNLLHAFSKKRQRLNRLAAAYYILCCVIVFIHDRRYCCIDAVATVCVCVLTHGGLQTRATAIRPIVKII